MSSLVELFPDTAALEDGELSVGGIRLSDLAAEYGTPLVVYDEATILSAVQAYRAAAPEALLVYGVKAFPNAAVLRLLADEGVGADVSTLGELELALRAGVPGERLVVHGNNKSDEELAAAAGAEAAFVVVDALDEVERAAQAGVRRILVRVTPGVEADTHPSIRTAHEGSKFGLPPEDALEALGARAKPGSRPPGCTSTSAHSYGRARRARHRGLDRRFLGSLSRRARVDAGRSSTWAAGSASSTWRARRRSRSRTSSASCWAGSRRPGPSATFLRPVSCSSRDARWSAGPGSRCTRSES